MEQYDSHRVLGIEELRSHVFAFADNSTLARCARVCSTWTDGANDLLWEKMDDIIPLFQVVHRMNIVSGLHAYPPNYMGSWRRFLQYGRRIKTFTLSWASIRRLNYSAYAELSRRRPTFSITPNLRTLHIHTGQKEATILDFSLLFLHESIEHVSIRIPQDKFLFSSFIELAVLRVPALQSLELRADRCMAIDHFEDNFVKLLSELSELRVLRVPYYSLTTRIVHAIEHHASLEFIAFQDGPALVTVSDVKFPKLKSDAFPALTKLQISGSFSSLAPLIAAPTESFSKKLTSLTLQVISLEIPTSLSLFVEMLTLSLPMLSHLTIEAVPQLFDFDDIPEEGMDVSPATLDPIASLKRLVEFNISWPAPIEVSNDGLVTLLSKMRYIQKLSLNSCPVLVENPSGLSLDILRTISQLCPNLRSLALYVDCTVVPNWNASVFAEHGGQRRIKVFSNLQEFDLGFSPLCQDDWALSMCLSKILPHGCQLTYRNRWMSRVEMVVENKHGNLKENRWPGKYERIAGVTKTLISARLDERQHAFTRIRVLEGRVRTLQLTSAKENGNTREFSG